MILPFVLFAVLMLIALLVFLYVLYPGSQRVTTIPGLDPSTEEEGNVPDISRAGSLTQFLIDLHKEHGPIVSFWINKELIVSIASPETHKEVAHLFDRPVSLYESFLPLLGKESVQYRNGPEGQHYRKIHDREFTQAKIVDKFPMIQQCAEELCTKWSSMIGGEEHIPLSVHMSAYVMKTLMRFAFGDYFKDEKALLDFRRDYDQCFWTMENALVEGPMVPGSEKETKFNEALGRMKKVVSGIIKLREETEVAPEDHVFVDTLLDKYDNEDMMFDDMITYLVGGSHTTAFYLTWALYLLAEHQDIQDKVYKEITSCYKGGPVTMETMKNMKYLQNVMNEVMRYSKLAPYAARFSPQDCVIGGHKVPKETPVIISIGTVMGDEKLWPDPEKFDPDRFNNKIPAFAYEPFGFAGKRKCPGYRLTELEAQLLLVLTLRQFKVLMVPGQVVEAKHGLVTKPSEEIWVTVEKRK